MSETSQIAAAKAAVVFLLLATMWVYWPGRMGPALLDDLSSLMVIGDLQEHPELAWDYVTGDTSGPLGRPVSIATFVIEKLLLGNSLVISKQVNIVLHLFNGLLVIWLFWLLFRYREVSGYHWLAVILGAAWLLSPLFVSTVLYAVQRMAMLSTTFMVLACISYVYWRLAFLRNQVSGLFLALSVISVVLAVFAKENAVVVIPVLLLLEALWFQFVGVDGRPVRWLRITSLSLMGLGSAIVVLVLVLDYDGLASNFGHRYFTLEERLLTQARVLWDYIGQIFAPDILRMGLYHDDLVVSTAVSEPASTLNALLAWSGVTVLFILSLFWQWSRYLALGIAWYLVGHTVESTVLPLELYFEHRNYFPALGLFLLVGAAFAMLVKRWPETTSPLLVYMACYTLWLASLTGSQVQVWSSRPLLTLNHLNAHPQSFRANSDMAVQMANLGAFEAAQEYSARAYAVSNGERSGDHDIRDLALACIANKPVTPDQIERLGKDIPERPFGSSVTLQTMVHLLQDNTCPEFDRLHFADRMREIFLVDDSPATASANIYLGLALLENVLQRWQNAEAYIDLFLQLSPGDAQGLLMKLHFVSALGKVAEIDKVKARLRTMQEKGQLTVGEQQTLSLYLEK
jgi:hypothetical protein